MAFIHPSGSTLAQRAPADLENLGRILVPGPGGSGTVAVDAEGIVEYSGGTGAAAPSVVLLYRAKRAAGTPNTEAGIRLQMNSFAELNPEHPLTRALSSAAVTRRVRVAMYAVPAAIGLVMLGAGIVIGRTSKD